MGRLSSALETGLGIDLPSRAAISRAVVALVTTGFVVGWSAFWTLVARNHVVRGSFLDAGFTFLVMAGPALVWLVDALDERVSVDLPAPHVKPDYMSA